jgi:hypothetical protein
MNTSSRTWGILLAVIDRAGAADQLPVCSFMTRDSSARELLAAFDRLGVRGGRIDLPDVWPTLAGWWSTPVTDLAGAQEEELAFLLSLSPASHGERATIFAGRPPAAIAGRELVRLDFEREFKERLDDVGRIGISGGAGVSFWYGYDPAWQRLRERSDWIEMGVGTPQIDAFSDGRDPGKLIRYVEETSGVLHAAAERRALALVVVDGAGDEQLLVVRRGS